MSLVQERGNHVAEGTSLAANPARGIARYLAARLGIEPLLLAQMESGEEPIPSAIGDVLEAMERERAHGRLGS